MKFNQLEQWLSQLESLIIDRSPAEALLAGETVAKRLHLLPCSRPVITVTGTNGKGSCVSLLETIYLEAGYKVGTFTSPHLLSFNERIRINNQPVADEMICEAYNKIDQARGSIELTYFQFILLAALILFQESNVDLLVLEVGFGGLYDIVNIVDADLSIISSIALDHCEKLGYTREAIAIQKAGIMRKGKVSICGDPSPPVTFGQEVERIGSTPYYQGKDFMFHEEKNTWSWQNQKLSLKSLPKPCIKLSNASAVLMAVTCFNFILNVPHKVIIRGLQKAYLPARCELINFKGLKILLDVAHNPAAAENLFHFVQSLNHPGKKYIITGMLKNKDITGTLHFFRDSAIDKWFLATLKGERGTNAKHLANVLEDIGIKNFLCYDAPCLAFKKACQEAVVGDLIIIFGSFYTVADIMENINFYSN